MPLTCVCVSVKSHLTSGASVRPRARRQFFALGSAGGFLGHSNPLSAREVFETCVIPTLLYGAENWILDDGCLELLERFQAEIGRRILKLSRYHSGLAVRIGLSLPSMTSRVLFTHARLRIHLPSTVGLRYLPSVYLLSHISPLERLFVQTPLGCAPPDPRLG